MRTLYIDLQEGFNNDTVIILVNGEEIFRKDGVQTKLLLGFSETLSVPVSTGEVELKIQVPSRSLDDEFKFTIQKNLYVGISITDLGIETIVTDAPFMYQ